MIVAAYRSGVYDFFLFLHILSVIVAFAPAAINPLLDRHFENNGGDSVLQNWYGFAAGYTQRISMPALVVTLVTGVIMILQADVNGFDVIEFSDMWVSLAFLVWIAIAGVVSGMIGKAEKQVGGGDMSARAKVAMGGQIATVLLAIMLILMIWKPGA